MTDRIDYSRGLGAAGYSLSADGNCVPGKPLDRAQIKPTDLGSALADISEQTAPLVDPDALEPVTDERR